MEFSKELLAKAKAAPSGEALFALARENGIPMTQEDADRYFAELHKTGELSDQELENVTGGGCGGPKRNGDGYLIVKGRDRCNLWECKLHRSSAYRYVAHVDTWYPTCVFCDRIVWCSDCYYCKKIEGKLCCTNPSK